MKFIISSVLVAAAPVATSDADKSICSVKVIYEVGTVDNPPSDISPLATKVEVENEKKYDTKPFEQQIQKDWDICAFEDGQIKGPGKGYDYQVENKILAGYNCWVQGCSNCAKAYDQCGGKKDGQPWTGATCCAPYYEDWSGGKTRPMHCVHSGKDQWYYQCEPVDGNSIDKETLLKAKDAEEEQSTESVNTTNVMI
jgi:hypothetical protein